MLAKNEVLQDRYRIIRQLGHGGMGAVYEAKDERLGSSVALKEIIIELHKIPNAKQQDIIRRAFEREARLLASLHHEAFPRVTDYFSEGDTQFLIMELINGDDLGERLTKNQKPFSFENIVKWTEQLLDALDYLHTQHPPTFHRDIKPQNLKVTSRGKIKLLDFGIAKSVDAAGSTITNQTFVGATLNYSPIEQVLPALPETFREFIVLKHSEKAQNILSQNTDARCDIYAIGATIYHLLTNKMPMDSAKRSLEIWEDNPDPLPNPIEFNSKITPAFSAWLLKAMEVERENRFASAIEMQKSLLEAIQPEKSKVEVIEKPPIIEITPVVIEPEIPPTQKVISKEQILMQVDTKQLITRENLNFESINEFIPKTQPVITTPSINTSSDTNSLDNIQPVTKSGIAQSSKTDSVNLSKSDLTGTPYYDEKLLAKKEAKPVNATFIFRNTNLEPNPKYFWLLSILAFSILTVSGIGVAIWMKNLNTPDLVKPIVNTPVSPPTVEPSISPIIKPKSSSTPAISDKPNDTSKPAIIATPTKKPTQNTVKAPPSQTPKLKSDDCIYNGRGC